eukprot:gene33849-40952_t
MNSNVDESIAHGTAADNSSKSKSNPKLISRILPRQLVAVVGEASRMWSQENAGSQVVYSWSSSLCSCSVASPSAYPKHHCFDIDALTAAIHLQRACLMPRKDAGCSQASSQQLAFFDRMWHLDSSTGLFTVFKLRYPGRLSAEAKQTSLLLRNHGLSMRELETVAKAVQGLQLMPTGGLLHDDDAFELNAPTYLFVSYQLARNFPQRVESYVVQHYRSRFPGVWRASWQKKLRRYLGHSSAVAAIADSGSLSELQEASDSRPDLFSDTSANTESKTREGNEALSSVFHVHRAIRFVNAVSTAMDRQPSQHPSPLPPPHVLHTHDDEACDADVGEVLPAASVPRIWQTKRPKRAEGLRAPSPTAGLEEGELYEDIMLDEVYSMSSSSDEDDSGSLDDDSWSSSVSSI